MTSTDTEIQYIELRLGWELGSVGVERAARLKNLGATLDEIVEALTLL